MTGYRYTLTRTINAFRPGLAAWCMINPSVAGINVDDPTIRKVCGFTDRLGFGRLLVVNMYPMRATKPRVLLAADEATRLGDRSRADDAIREATQADLLIVAWGGVGGHRTVAGRLLQVWDLIQAYDPQCLDMTLDGQPRHPLMLPYQRTERLDSWCPP